MTCSHLRACWASGSASQSKRQRVVDNSSDSDDESNDVNTAMEIVPANAAGGDIVFVDTVVSASEQPSDIEGFSPDLLRLYYGTDKDDPYPLIE